MHGIEQTLAEQLNITEREINKRKSLLQFTNEDGKQLSGMRPYIAERIDVIVERFYEYQTAFPDIALLIGDAETLNRLRSVVRLYILELFDGIYDREYVNKRLRIGKVHKRIGVSPKLYMAAIHKLQEILHEEIEARAASIGQTDAVGMMRASLNKIITFDIELVFDTYISSLVSEVSAAKQELEDQVDSLEASIADRTLELEELSRQDGLTGLNNKQAFQEQLRRHLAGCQRYRESLTLAYFDLNGFKQVNDQFGHQEGDDLLALVADHMKATVRPLDVACRVGGDEFAIILPRTVDVDAINVLSRICHNIHTAGENRVTFSFGVVTSGPEELTDGESLVQQADQLMYRAKEQSRIEAGDYYATVYGEPQLIRRIENRDDTPPTDNGVSKAA